MSETPRTDAEEFTRARARGWFKPGKHCVAADFARTLERELAAALSELEKAKEDARDDAAYQIRCEQWTGDVTMDADEVLAGIYDLVCGYRPDAESDGEGTLYQRVKAAVELHQKTRAELADARECLREAIVNFGELCPGSIDRWRKAAGMDVPTQ